MKPDFMDYVAARTAQSGAAIAVGVVVIALFVIVGVLGAILRIPYLEIVLGALGFVGLCVAVFIANDTNTTVRLMRERVEDQESAENAWTRRYKED